MSGSSVLVSTPWAPGMPGCLAVAKPAGLTSHDVVDRARRMLGERRIGHAGTLDPDATGVLVLGIGTATRLLRFATAWTKSYLGEVVLGIETSTLDASGEVTATHDMGGVTLVDVAAAAARLTGRIEQLPPMVSAVKVGGRRLHELARRGIEVERTPRSVEVHRFEVSRQSGPGRFWVEVDCSSGTYVRVLAADLGHVLGGGAHLASLHRGRVGPFTDADAVALDALAAGTVRPPARLLAGLETVLAPPAAAVALRQGKQLEAAALGASGSGPVAVLDASGGVVAVCERSGARLKPAVVLPDAHRSSE